MNRNIKLAAAVAAVLGTGTAFATGPTITQANSNSAVKLFIAGSSAAQPAVLGVINNVICPGVANTTEFVGSPNANFLAFSCIPVNGGVAGGNGSTVYTIFYRTEGGSVSGVLPIVNNKPVRHIDLSQTSLFDPSAQTDLSGCPASTATANAGQLVCSGTISGTSTANGADDSFFGATATAANNVGISDVEPSALIGNNYPTAYSTSVWGPNAEAVLATTPSTPLFDQVFGILVNTTNTGGTGAWVSTGAQNLGAQMVQAILSRNVKARNWSQVTDVNGQLVYTGGSLPITVVNREAGSGSRTTVDLTLMGDTCLAGAGALADPGPTDYFSTGDVVGAANTLSGAITYATIDKASGNLKIVNLNGVVPSTTAAGSGAYPIWSEATFLVNPNNVATGSALTLQTALFSAMQTLHTTSHASYIMANPALNTPVYIDFANHKDSATGTLAGLGTAAVFINPFTRGSVTCTRPVYSATAQ